MNVSKSDVSNQNKDEAEGERKQSTGKEKEKKEKKSNKQVINYCGNMFRTFSILAKNTKKHLA